MGKPDWNFWGQMKIRPWQGCALSLDLDPDEIEINPNSWMAGPGGGLCFNPGSFPNSEVKTEFDKRLRLVKANLSIFVLSSIVMGEPDKCEIEVPAFAKGALSLGLELPQALADLAKTQNSSPPSQAERQTSPAADRPLMTIERNTLLTIIAALCDYSGIKTEERGAANQIAKLTEEIGAPVSDDTVRRWLNQIPDALESRMR